MTSDENLSAPRQTGTGSGFALAEGKGPSKGKGALPPFLLQGRRDEPEKSRLDRGTTERKRVRRHHD